MSGNIMIVGVGGQGTLLASRILGTAILKCGYDVKLSEVHGMAQRGGSVVTYVKYGEKVSSPVITKGEADLVISFELLEAARWLPFLKVGGKMIVSDQRIDPMPVITGAAKYPEDLAEKIKAAGIDITVVDALSIAEELGFAKAANVVITGVMAAKTSINKEYFIEAMTETIKPHLLETNLKAFELGYNFGG